MVLDKCPRRVAEFTKTVAKFTKSSLAGQKLLQLSKILFIFVAKLLITIIAAKKATIPKWSILQ
jgi:hypothetical protein